MCEKEQLAGLQWRQGGRVCGGQDGARQRSAEALDETARARHGVRPPPAQPSPSQRAHLVHAALRRQVCRLLGRRALHAPVPHALRGLAGLRQRGHRRLAGAVPHRRHQPRRQQLAAGRAVAQRGKQRGMAW